MTTPLTGATLTAQRAQARWKTYHLAIYTPNTIMSARVNQADIPATVNQLTYDGASGSYADVKPGMTCFIGSAAGLSDIAVLRVRKALTATEAYFGPVSGAAIVDNAYLTFVDFFGLHSRQPIITDTSELMDQDVEFGAASSFAPIVKIGPLAVVLELDGATVAYSPTATIYSPTGATASAYLWTAPGASATANTTTATPTLTYNAVGDYYISCTVTDSAGATSTAYRAVMVRSTDDAQIGPPQISGDVDAGGFSVSIEGYSGVDIASLQDGALCVIWRKDYASTARATSYGPYTGAQAVRFVGWLNGETLTIDPVKGTASFTIDGPAAWMERVQGAPCFVQDGSPATSWHHIAGLTTDKALYRLLYWQSTLCQIADITFTGDTTAIYTANVNSDSLRGQVDGLAGEKLLSRLCFDEYGCGFVTVPPSLRTSAGKSANTILWDVASSDWIEELDIERVTTEQSAQVEIGGRSWDGTTETEIYSRAPGLTPAHYGSIDAPAADLALASQAMCNQLSGDLLASENSEYPSIGIRLYWPNDYAGYAMAQGWLTRLTIFEVNNPRGIAFIDKRFSIDAVSFEFDVETGAESTVLELAEETTGAAGATYYPPQPSDDGGVPIPGAGGLLVPPISNWYPPSVPPEPPAYGSCSASGPANVFRITFDKSTLTGTDSVLSSFAYYPCKIRALGATNGPTTIQFDCWMFGDMTTDPLASLACYAIDAAQNRILTGTLTKLASGNIANNTIFASFAPLLETDVAGFELVITAGGGTSSFEIGSLVASGTVAANDATGDAVTLVANQYYAVNNDGTTYWNGVTNVFGVILSDNVTDLLAGETIAFQTTRRYFLANGTSSHVTVNDNNFGDNSGSQGWFLYNATPNGSRRLTIQASQIYNICRAG